MNDELSVLAIHVKDRLLETGATLATAESCSGGLIAHTLTNIPGISTCYLGGVVVYSNALKERLLGVRAETLEAHGAVSEETAREMAAGTLARLGATYAVAVTGIAGPDGGTPEKPVGLVYIAAAGPRGVTVRRNEFQGNRAEIKEQTVSAALRLAVEWMNE